MEGSIVFATSWRCTVSFRMDIARDDLRFWIDGSRSCAVASKRVVASAGDSD